MARISSELIPEETLDRAVEILKVVANPFRLQILTILFSGEVRVKQLKDKLGLQESNTSNQLGRLRSHGVLKSRRDGNKKYYSLANNSIKKIVESIIVDI